MRDRFLMPTIIKIKDTYVTIVGQVPIESGQEVPDPLMRIWRKVKKRQKEHGDTPSFIEIQMTGQRKQDEIILRFSSEFKPRKNAPGKIREVRDDEVTYLIQRAIADFVDTFDKWVDDKLVDGGWDL